MQVAQSILFVLLVTVGCETQKIEYRSRPAWHYSMNNSIENQFTLDDGTIVKYSPVGGQNSAAVKKYLDSIQLEEINELTGEITLRGVLPEHVHSQLLTCLRDRDWDLLYEQILSEEARYYFESRENGNSEFQSFFESNRRDLAKLLQRMIKGSAFGDVRQTENGDFMITMLTEHASSDYRFKKITLIRENDFLKLFSIE